MKEKNAHRYDTFIFTHIPKCGGTSFRRYICDLAADSQIPKDRIHAPGQNGTSNEKNLEQLAPDEIELLNNRNIKVLADHTLFGGVEQFGLAMKCPFYYTILRKPVERFISHYNFFCRKLGNRGCEGLSIKDLSKIQFNDVLSVFSNLPIRYLLNYRSGVIRYEHLHSAKKVLTSQFAAFGILEMIEESVLLLQKDLPVWLSSDRAFPELNRNKQVDQIDPSSPRMEQIRQANALEIELYDHARSIFERRYAELVQEKGFKNKSK